MALRSLVAKWMSGDNPKGSSAPTLHAADLLVNAGVSALTYPIGTISRGMQLRPDLTAGEVCRLILANAGYAGFYRGYALFLFEAFFRWEVGFMVDLKLRNLREKDSK